MNNSSYEFFIESKSLSILYPEMMIAHVNGDLIHEAKKMTLVNDIVISKFFALQLCRGA